MGESACNGGVMEHPPEIYPLRIAELRPTDALYRVVEHSGSFFAAFLYRRDAERFVQSENARVARITEQPK